MPAVVPAATAEALYTVKGAVRLGHPPARYQFGLFLALLSILLLPAVYFGVMVLVAAATWWHLASNTWLLANTGPNIFFWLMVYLFPVGAAAIVLFFMVKPVLSRPARRPAFVTVVPEQEPALFGLITQICAVLAVRVPDLVEVDQRPNASVSRLPGGRLALTIGLPLVAGLSVRELGGVLAHEMCHLQQRHALRVTAIVDAINTWFLRVASERDKWDASLEREWNDGDLRNQTLLFPVRLAIKSVRWLMQRLQVLGQLVGSNLRRHMERQADTWEVEIAGSEAFARTVGYLSQIHVASASTRADLHSALLHRRLPAQFAQFLTAKTRGAHPIHDDSTGMSSNDRFRTHPTDAERLRSAASAARAGILEGDGPATTLFSNFDQIDRDATRWHYEHHVGLNVGVITLVDGESAARVSNERAVYGKAVETFFGGAMSIHRPITVPLDKISIKTDEVVISTIRDARRYMVSRASPHEQYRRFESLENTRDEAMVVQELVFAGFDGPSMPHLDLHEGAASNAADASDRARAQQRGIGAGLDDFERAAAQRLACGLVLQGRCSDPAASTTGHAMAAALNAIASVQPNLAELRRLWVAWESIHLFRNRCPQPELIGPRERYFGERLGTNLSAVRTGLGDVLEPFAARGSSVTLVASLGWTGEQWTKPPGEIGALAMDVYFRALGHLASIALAAEARIDTQTIRPPSSPGSTAS